MTKAISMILRLSFLTASASLMIYQILIYAIVDRDFRERYVDHLRVIDREYHDIVDELPHV